MQYFILGVTLLVALLFCGRWFVEADPRKVAGGLTWGGLAIAAVVLLLLGGGGRVMLLAALVPAGIWAFRLFQRFKTAQGPSAGQSSEVRTRFLQMSLDHDSGDLDGRVLDGRYEGRLLSQLALPELVELLQDYALADQQSASVLEAYLDRTRPEWRGAEEEPAAAGAGQTGAGQTGRGQAGAEIGRASSRERGCQYV